MATAAPGRRGVAWYRRPDIVGPALLVLTGLGVIAVAAGWVNGRLATLVTVLLLAFVTYVVIVAIAGGPSARKRLAPYGLLTPGTLWLCLFFLAPLWALMIMSLSAKEGRFDFAPSFSWHWDNYRTAFTDFGPQFTRSFLYAGTATLLCIIIGYPLAYVIAFKGGRFKDLLLGLVVIPFFTSYLIRTIAWQALLADQGPILGVLSRLHLVGVLEFFNIADNGRLMNTWAAVIGGLTYNFLPFMVLPIYVSLEKIDQRLVGAAMDLYATPARAFRKVTLPLSLPGVFAGTLLCFIPASGDFINAELLGNPNTTMIGNSIQNQFLKQLNYPLAASMSFVLMVVITIGVLIYTKLLGTEDIA